MMGAVMPQLLKRAPAALGQPARGLAAMPAPMAARPSMAPTMPAPSMTPATVPGIAATPTIGPPKPPMQAGAAMGSGMVAPTVRDQLLRRAPMMGLAGRR